MESADLREYTARVKRSVNFTFDDKDEEIERLVGVAEAQLLHATGCTEADVKGEGAEYPSDFAEAIVALAGWWFLNPQAGSDRAITQNPFYQGVVSHYTKLTAE